jgi:hypothetical protein
MDSYPVACRARRFSATVSDLVLYFTDKAGKVSAFHSNGGGS